MYIEKNKNPLDGFAPHLHIQKRSYHKQQWSVLDMKRGRKAIKRIALYISRPRVIRFDLLNVKQGKLLPTNSNILPNDCLVVIILLLYLVVHQNHNNYIKMATKWNSSVNFWDFHRIVDTMHMALFCFLFGNLKGSFP